MAGGESGPKSRPSHPDWFRSLRDQCQVAEVPYLFKQWGEWWPVTAGDELPTDRLFDAVGTEEPVTMRRLGKKAAGHDLDGRTWDEIPVAQVGTSSGSLL